MRNTVNFAGALLLGLLIAVVPKGLSATAQGYDPGHEVATFFGLSLFGSLFSPPPATEKEQLRDAAADYSRAQAAWSRGPSESGDAEIEFGTARDDLRNLAKNARSPRARRLARGYLSRLPKHFARGHSGKMKVSEKKRTRRHSAAAPQRSRPVSNTQVHRAPVEVGHISLMGE